MADVTLRGETKNLPEEEYGHIFKPAAEIPAVSFLVSQRKDFIPKHLQSSLTSPKHGVWLSSIFERKHFIGNRITLK